MNKETAEQEALFVEPGLTPSDLVNAALKTNIFGGYSKNQVDILLERAADLLELLLRDNKDLRERKGELEQSLEKYRDMENSLRSALISSQKMGENMVVTARLQADAMLEEARAAKAQALFKMEKLPDAIRAEIRRLADARERLRDDLASLLETHTTLIERIPRAEEDADAFVREELSRGDSFSGGIMREREAAPPSIRIVPPEMEGNVGHGFVNI